MGKKKKGGNNEVNQLLQGLKQLMLSTPAGPRPGGSGTSKRKRRKKKSAGRGAVSQDGTINLQRCELVASVVIPKTQSEASGIIDIVPGSFTFLKSLATSFDRLRWNTMHFYYKPAVGTVYGGLVTVGVDWDFASSASSRKTVASFTPSLTMAAWADTERAPMVLPVSRLQSRSWYVPSASVPIDKGPGRIHWAASGTVSNSDTTLGEIWVRYSVTMQGTNPA